MLINVSFTQLGRHNCNFAYITSNRYQDVASPNLGALNRLICFLGYE